MYLIQYEHLLAEEKKVIEMIDADPAMKELAEEEIQNIKIQKINLQIENIMHFKKHVNIAKVPSEVILEKNLELEKQIKDLA